MPEYISVTDLNLADLLSDIEDTQISDFVGQYSTQNNDEDIVTSGQFQLQGGLQMTFDAGNDFIYRSDDRFTYDLTVRTIFELVSDTDGPYATIYIDDYLTFTESGGFNLLDVLTNASDIRISSHNSVVSGFDQSDTIRGTGTLDGGAGNDIIRLGVGDLGASSIFTMGNGGLGNDIIETWGDRTCAMGGAGADTFHALGGHVGMFGGSGADTFVFDNGHEKVDISDNVFAIIRDFDVSEDTVMFGDAQGTGSVEGSAFRIDDITSPTSTLSFADAFGTDDLSTLSHVTYEDQIFFFGHAADGDARIFRRGTDADGFEFSENVRFDGLTLSDLDASQIYLAEFSVLL